MFGIRNSEAQTLRQFSIFANTQILMENHINRLCDWSIHQNQLIKRQLGLDSGYYESANKNGIL